MPSAKYTSRAVKQTAGYGRSRNIGLLELEGRACTTVDVTLTPALNRCCSTSKNDFAAGSGNSGRNVLKIDVVEDKRTCERGRWLAVLDEYRSIDHCCIDYSNCSDGLSGCLSLE